MRNHISLHNLAERFQSAYRKHHSTETALLKVINDVLLHLDNRDVVFMNLLDLSAAFDTLDHDVMLRRLRVSFGIQGTALNWFKSYLENRMVQVCVNEIYSSTKALSCSAPQGSKLGPALYSNYTNPLGNLMTILAVCYHCYADDTQIYKSVNPKDYAAQQSCKCYMEDCVRQINGWMSSNRLQLNQDKTKFIIFASRFNSRHIQVDSLQLTDSVIRRSDVVRNLGVHLDYQLNMKRHLHETRKTCFYYMKWISSIRHMLTMDATKYLVQALIVSRLDYCNAILCELPKTLIDELQSVQNAAARLIVRCPRDSHITSFLKQLHWLPISHRIKYKVLCLTYKGQNGLAPDYIKDMLCSYVPTRRLRSSNQNLLAVPSTNLGYGKRAFSVAAPRLWNSLPL